MSNNDNDVTSTAQSPKGSGASDEMALVLPCSVNQFGTFLSGLLKRPQTIEGREYGDFDIGLTDIINVVHLVEQRVHAQNEATIAAFEISVIYSNGNRVTHSTIESFTKYHPVEKCHPVEVSISLTYIITFNKSDAPEKQRIEISFVSEGHRHPDRMTRRLYFFGGIIEYKIEYSERTWGSDISALLANHAKNLVNDERKILKFCHEHFDLLTSTVFSFVFLSSLAFLCYLLTKNAESLVENDQLVHFVPWSLFVATSFATILGIAKRFFEFNLILRRRSFITLVENDSKHKQKILKRQRRQHFIGFGSWVASVLASILASAIYSALL